MANLVEQFTEGVREALAKVGGSFIEIVPSVVIAVTLAIITIAIGWFIGNVVKKIVIRVLQSTRIDQWVDEQNLTAAIGGKEMSSLVGSFVKWYIIWVSVWVAAESIQLQALSNFLQMLVFYIPKALVALVVMVLGLILGRYIKNALETTQYSFKKIAAGIAEVIVVILAGVLALTLLLEKENVEPVIIVLKTFVDPFLWSIAIAVGIMAGISFGLAFKDDIQKFALEIKKGYAKK